MPVSPPSLGDFDYEHQSDHAKVIMFSSIINRNTRSLSRPELTDDCSLVWGSDASGTMQGAGGVGGLVSMSFHSTPNPDTYFYVYDGSYNVTALVSGGDGSLRAQYDYGPFGEPIRATELGTTANAFLFSTRFYDSETAVYYYGYRYYRPALGAWASSHPLQEGGGKSLYAFVANNPLATLDRLGLACHLITVSRGHCNKGDGGAEAGLQPRPVRVRRLRR